MNPDSPWGPDEVQAEVIRAATTMFARQCPQTVTLRQIARQAGVSYALINRYFGTKEELRQTVIDTAMSAIRSELEDVTPEELYPHLFLLLSGPRADEARIVMRALSEGADPVELRRDPLVGVQVRQAAAPAWVPSSLHPQLLAAALGAIVMSWSTLEDWIVAAAPVGMDVDRAALRTQMADLLRILSGPGPGCPDHTPVASTADPS